MAWHQGAHLHVVAKEKCPIDRAEPGGWTRDRLLVTQAEQKDTRLADVARTGSGRVVGHSYKARMPLLSMAVLEALEDYAVARSQSTPIGVFQKWQVSQQAERGMPTYQRLSTNALHENEADPDVARRYAGGSPQTLPPAPAWTAPTGWRGDGLGAVATSPSACIGRDISSCHGEFQNAVRPRACTRST